MSPCLSPTPTFLFLSSLRFSFSSVFDGSTHSSPSTFFSCSALFDHSAMFAISPTFRRSPVHRQSGKVYRSRDGSIPLADSESIGETSMLMPSITRSTVSLTTAAAGTPSGIGALIAGTIIGAIVVLIVVVFVLVMFHQRWKRNKVDRKSDNDESVASGIQFVEDTIGCTTDETLVSYHDSLTYEGGSLGSNNFPTRISRDAIHISLL
jgi:hypothetical protein